MTYTNRYRTTGASRARFSLRSSGRSIRSAELDARKAERDDEGNPTWRLDPRNEPEDWTGMWVLLRRPARRARGHSRMRLAESVP